MTLKQSGNGIKIIFQLRGRVSPERIEREKLILNHRVKQLEVRKVVQLFSEDEVYGDD